MQNMNLMTVDELIKLFVEDGITSTGQEEVNVMLKLDACNIESVFNRQYILLGELASLVMQFMSLAGYNIKKWP